MTIFDVLTTEEYQKGMQDMSQLLISSGVRDIFFETFDELTSLPYESCKKTNNVFRLGVDSNPKRYTDEEAKAFGIVEPGKVYTFNHFHLDLPKAFVDMSGKSIESIQADYRSAKEVFQRTSDIKYIKMGKKPKEIEEMLMNGEIPATCE